MKRILVSLALLACSAFSAQAQVEHRFVNTTIYDFGLTTTLQFRNTNQYGDPNIYVIGDFGIGLSQRVQDYCTAPVLLCNISGLVAVSSGNVQESSFYAGQTQWREGGAYVPITSPSNYQFHVPFYIQPAVYGVFGCQVPERPSGVGDYVARTCAADGFDGWMSTSIGISLQQVDGVEGVPLDLSDLTFGFDVYTIPGPNAMRVVPEPGTYALVAFGFVAIGLIRRRRRENRA